MAELSVQELKVKFQQRITTRANTTKEIKKIPQIIAITPLDVAQLETISKQLAILGQKLVALDDLILPTVSDEKLADEVERAEEYQNQIISAVSNIDIQLRNHALVTANTPNAPASGRDLAPRLPKLEIAKYSGDPLLWDEFWDNFQSCIHERTDLPTIDKFKYLKSFLEGEALRLADGYRLTVSNYDQVLQALKERFGDPEIATFSHFEALIALSPASYNLSELRVVLDKCESHIRSLTALGLDESTFGVVFTPLILSKLPKGVKIELHRKNGSTPWRLANLRTLLKEEINARERGERVFASTTDHAAKPEAKSVPPKSKTTSNYNSNRRPITTTNLASSVSEKSKAIAPSCAFCAGKHYSSACRLYPDIDSRLKQLKDQCHACLRKGHRAPECRSKRPCYFCRNDRHHQSLCPVNFKRTAGQREESLVASTSNRNSTLEESTSTSKPESNLSLQTPNSKSILQTALASVRGKHCSTTARLYFDTDGSRSFISTSAAKKIGASLVRSETVSVGRFRDSKRSSVTYDIYEFDICLPNGKSKTVRMSSESTISCPIQLIPLHPKQSPILASVKLAEPLVEKPTMVTIDILIGNDYYYHFIGDEQIRCSNGVVLLSSPFGYITGGSICSSSNRRQYESTLLIDTLRQPLPPQTLEHFWSLEDVGIKENCHQTDDEIALQSFKDNVKFEENRYSVKWPWKSETPELPDNFGLAFGRLKSLVKRFEDHPDLLQIYDQTLQDQLAKGIIEEVAIERNQPQGSVHYIPHHCVVSPSKKTTKVRIVYDASAKSSKDLPSLNDCLFRGPVLLADSVGMILRWRLPKIAIISDIEKAFLQVMLQKSERNVTRFLWLKDPKAPLCQSNLRVFRFCRVPFGVISSPFLLAATVAHHLKLEGGPIASSIETNSKNTGS